MRRKFQLNSQINSTGRRIHLKWRWVDIFPSGLWRLSRGTRLFGKFGESLGDGNCRFPTVGTLCTLHLYRVRCRMDHHVCKYQWKKEPLWGTTKQIISTQPWKRVLSSFELWILIQRWTLLLQGGCGFMNLFPWTSLNRHGPFHSRLLVGMVVILSVEFMDYDINKKNVIETDLILMKYYQSIDRRLSTMFNLERKECKESPYTLFNRKWLVPQTLLIIIYVRIFKVIVAWTAICYQLFWFIYKTHNKKEV